MKTTTILLGFLFIFQTATAQDDFWEEIQVPDSINHIRSILGINNNSILLGSDSGLYISFNNGNSWQFAGLSKQNYNALYQASNGYIFVCVNGVSVFFSPDTAQTWIETSAQFMTFFEASIFMSSNGNLYLGGEGNIYRSLDTGQTWQMVYYCQNEWTRWMSGIEEHPITGTLYATVCEYQSQYYSTGLFTSQTGDSSTWVNSDLQEYSLTAMGISKNGIIYLGKSYPSIGILKSIDNGATWTSFGMGEPKDIDILFGEDVYVATMNGVYRQYAGQYSFTPINSGLETLPSDKIAYAEPYLYVSSYYFPQLYRSKEPVMSSDKLENKPAHKKMLIFPNPVSSGNSFHIKTNMSEKSNIKVVLYNCNGKVVREFKKTINRNTNLLTVNTTGLKRGVHFFTIYSTTHEMHGKIIIR